MNLLHMAPVAFVRTDEIWLHLGTPCQVSLLEDLLDLLPTRDETARCKRFVHDLLNLSNRNCAHSSHHFHDL